jgi:putative ABC transport system substrate-binding protein
VNTHTRRREFITLLSGAAAAWPLAARAQQPAMPVIGFLNSAARDEYGERLRLFHEGLAQTGYVEGRNVAIEYRWADGHFDRLPSLAAELARRPLRGIVTSGGFPSALAAKAATATIPIVFQGGDDPVAAGLVASLNRPGGNLTGVTLLNFELLAKRVEVLHEIIPMTTVIARLVNPTVPNVVLRSNELDAAARVLGVQLPVLTASTEGDFERVFAQVRELHAGGLAIDANSFLNNRSEQLAALALRHAVPTISFSRAFVVAGGLMSYGASVSEAWRTLGAYTGRILKGEKPADLPVQQATKVELVINLKTAKALGITFPLTLLGRADEVIE